MLMGCPAELQIIPVATRTGHDADGLLRNRSACCGFLRPVFTTSTLEKDGGAMCGQGLDVEVKTAPKAPAISKD